MKTMAYLTLRILLVIIVMTKYLLAFFVAPVLNVVIRSEGYEDPRRTPNTGGIAYIKVNGKDSSLQLRGLNVVIVSSVTGNKDGVDYFIVFVLVESYYRRGSGLFIEWSGFEPRRGLIVLCSRDRHLTTTASFQSGYD